MINSLNVLCRVIVNLYINNDCSFVFTITLYSDRGAISQMIARHSSYNEYRN